MTFDSTVNIGHIIQLIGMLGMAIALYYGIKIDLARLHDKHTNTDKKADKAVELAADAHEKIFKHVNEHHTNGKSC